MKWYQKKIRGWIVPFWYTNTPLFSRRFAKLSREMKLTTPKQVFEYIRDTEGFLEKQKYLCSAITELNTLDFISCTLEHECYDLMEKHKPENDSFTKFRYWNGGYFWWRINKAIREGKHSELMTEKRRFLTHLIQQL